MQGLHAIYKPKGVTSHDIITELRKITGIKTIGHAGTLDPLASGVLVVGIGKWAAKKLNQEVKKEKEYLARIKLGEKSSTDDQAGIIEKHSIKKIPSEKEIRKILKLFLGKIKQRPPDFSAKRIKGQRAYKIARRGLKPKLKEETVEIKEIKLIKYSWPYLDLKITCGPGTYIRSLARDLGEKLKTGAYLAELERTRVGNFTKEKSWPLEKFKKEFQRRKIVHSLALIIKNGKILLGLKKRGFGAGRWNGFGGKQEKNESIAKLLKREMLEETGIKILKYKKRGILLFEFKNNPQIIEMHIFSIEKYLGQPKESEEMKPKWFDFNKIPYSKMWPDDKYWLPLFLKGGNFRGEFYFKNTKKILYHSLRLVKKI